jgi:hypothetical protein
MDQKLQTITDISYCHSFSEKQEVINFASSAIEILFRWVSRNMSKTVSLKSPFFCAYHRLRHAHNFAPFSLPSPHSDRARAEVQRVSSDRGALSELFGLLNVAPQAIAPHATVVAVAHAACLLLGLAPGSKQEALMTGAADGFISTAAVPGAAAVVPAPAVILPAASADILPAKPADISSGQPVDILPAPAPLVADLSPPLPPTPAHFIAVARTACASGQLLHPLADPDMPGVIDSARFRHGLVRWWANISSQ